jgi:hypothetical protein
VPAGLRNSAWHGAGRVRCAGVPLCAERHAGAAPQRDGDHRADLAPQLTWLPSCRREQQVSNRSTSRGLQLTGFCSRDVRHGLPQLLSKAGPPCAHLQPSCLLAHSRPLSSPAAAPPAASMHHMPVCGSALHLTRCLARPTRSWRLWRWWAGHAPPACFSPTWPSS